MTIVPFRYANLLTIGDELLVQGNNKLTPAKVIHVSNLVMQGMFLLVITDIISND